MSGLRVPETVAVVGASRLEGGSYYGSRLLANVVNAGDRMRVFPVNPRYAGEEILGKRVYGTLSDLPVVPDLVLITTPVRFVPSVLREAGALGVPLSVVISSERGDVSARRALDDEVARIARESGMRIIGPNSVGVLNGVAALNGSYSSGTHTGGLRPGSVAVVAQSGAAVSYLLQEYQDTRFGYSWLISTGNEAAAGFEELFEEVVNDGDTRVILLFVEGIGDGVRFRRAALRAQAEGKAVVMVNVGVSAVGRDAVQSHTGRLAGADTVIAAVADEAGIIRAHSFEDLYDDAKSLAEQGMARRDRPHRRRAVVIATSGGAGALTADHLSASGWTLPSLPADIVAALEDVSRQKDIGNPIDITGVFADVTLMPRLLRVVAKDEGIDAIFIITGAGGTIAEGVAVEIARVAPEIPQELYLAWVGMTPDVRRALDSPGISAFPDPLRAVRAAEACAAFRSGQTQGTVGRELLALIGSGAGDSHPAPVAEGAGGEGTGLWTAAQTLAGAARAGVRCAPFAVSGGLDADDVASIAGRIGYPVAIKIDSPSLSHKSDAGGVRIDLGDRAALASAVADLSGIARRHRLDRPRILVQAMTRGVEALVGIKHDAAFGHVLVVGLGGTLAELHGEVVAAVLPTNRAALDRLVARHAKLARLLAGFRGTPAADRDSFLDLLEAVAAWAASKGPRLKEADFNPVMVNPDGAFAVDGRAVWA